MRGASGSRRNFSSPTLETAIDVCAESAETLGCARWLARTRDILERGASADRRLAVFRGIEDRDLALRKVVESLAEETGSAP